ncbi:hypothetical protein [Microvirga sp. BSC39]|uniref:hypothetical protein n=1 Tax=Microvirga sp. BSC39 TaxID=1549810 RepID=UPI00068C49C6|nr:hypothetical protein [Microvirga sp. BSC39]
MEDVSERGVTVGGELIPCSTIVWAAGVAASPAGQWQHVGTDRPGVLPWLQTCPCSTSTTSMCLAILLWPRTSTESLSRFGPGGDQQGRYLGKARLARILRHETPLPFCFRSRGNLAVVGRNSALIHWDSLKIKGFAARLLWGTAHVYLLVGFHSRFLVTMRWLWTYLTFNAERG